jgi:tetratricopeptide (TPR) repeat protein
MWAESCIKQRMRLPALRLGLCSSLLCAALLSVLGAALPQGAKANDFEEFEAARSAYESQDYARAAQLFEGLVGGDVPRLTNRSLVLESQKYLGASYLFLGKRDRASDYFERLLRMDPEYMLDPLAFPEEAQHLFAQVKTRLEAERMVAAAAKKREAENLARTQAERERKEHQRWEQLFKLAETEQVHEVRSRWLASVPFGVGQFQNGHDGLGLVLCVSEASLLAISVAAFILQDNLRGQTPAPNKIDDARLAEQAFRYTNQISFSLFAVLAVTGVIDAQARFQGTRTYERKRVLPPDLYGGPELSVWPGGANLRLRF